jgi:GxxExxY protein
MTYEPGSKLTEKIIGHAITVHRLLGPGLLETMYEQCLFWKLEDNGFTVRRQVRLPVQFEHHRLDYGFRADLIVDGTVLLELKSIEHILPIHEAQTRTYLKFSFCQIGLLMNFNAVMLKDGLRRYIPGPR